MQWGRGELVPGRCCWGRGELRGPRAISPTGGCQLHRAPSSCGHRHLGTPCMQHLTRYWAAQGPQDAPWGPLCCWTLCPPPQPRCDAVGMGEHCEGQAQRWPICRLPAAWEGRRHPFWKPVGRQQHPGHSLCGHHPRKSATGASPPLRAARALRGEQTQVPIVRTGKLRPRMVTETGLRAG